MAFADLVKQASTFREKGPSRGFSLVTEALSKYAEKIAGEPQERHNDGYFHASQIYELCARQYLLREMYPKVWIEDLDLSTRQNFDIGSALHHWYQDHYCGPAGILKGNWCCTGCNKVHKDSFMPTECEQCGNKPGQYNLNRAFLFQESGVYHHELKIKGHHDGALYLDSNGYTRGYVVDFKTIRSDLFERLEKPYDSYIFQINIYMWLANIGRGILVFYQ